MTEQDIWDWQCKMHIALSWDGLHNSPEGYDCVGRALARAILANAR